MGERNVRVRALSQAALGKEEGASYAAHAPDLCPRGRLYYIVRGAGWDREKKKKKKRKKNGGSG